MTKLPRHEQGRMLIQIEKKRVKQTMLHIRWWVVNVPIAVRYEHCFWEACKGVVAQPPSPPPLHASAHRIETRMLRSTYGKVLCNCSVYGLFVERMSKVIGSRALFGIVPHR